MEQYNFFCIESATDYIKEQGQFPKGQDIDSLSHLHAKVSSILERNQNQINLNWSVTLSRLAEIVLQERSQVKFEDDWIHLQTLKSKIK